MSCFTTTLKTEQIGKWTHILLADLVLADEEEQVITVPTGFSTDFASIRLLHNAFLFVLFALVSGYGNYAATVHDWLYTTGQISRKQADAVLYRALRAEGVARWRAWLFWAGVRIGGANQYTKTPTSSGFYVWGKVMDVTEKDRDVLARTLWGEARGEGLAGMVAVAWSIRNRVEDGKDRSWWGEGYAGVCQKPWQFSCWNKGDPNQPYLTGAMQIPFRELAQCRVAADQVIDGKVADPTNGATHYYATTMPKPPTWAAKATQTLKLGHHIFFRDVP